MSMISGDTTCTPPPLPPKRRSHNRSSSSTTPLYTTSLTNSSSRNGSLTRSGRDSDSNSSSQQLMERSDDTLCDALDSSLNGSRELSRADVSAGTECRLSAATNTSSPSQMSPASSLDSFNNDSLQYVPPYIALSSVMCSYLFAR